MKYYTGIGSRSTPMNILNLMTSIAIILETKEYCLRSGGADGADKAFEDGCINAFVKTKEIYLPWANFNNNPSPLHHIHTDAYKLAEKYHPAWNRCSEGGKKLHARNVYQILGQDLNTPSEFVICWTSDGKATGGTGQAIRIANDYNIPVYNLYNEKDKTLIIKLIASL
jgi:hypothetical protein